ncbi:NAD(P)H-hydrate dehydratase [Microbacterium chocolatum]|uniref:NAD(P)H-hydrate dehydratase n=1 Tax=Microbacterium aurantiacum TaxID=162393 RepID=UPI00338DD9A3
MTAPAAPNDPLWAETDARAHVRAPRSDDDKYRRGVVGLRTGADEYPGAAVLGVEAAWRSGAGMVRYIGPRRAEDLVLARRPETVTAGGRVQAWVLGSGTDAATRAPAETSALRDLLDGEVPIVVDAGALDLAPDASAPRILTPHAREHDRLRAALGLADAGADRAASVAETARAVDAVVLLKGARTLVAAPDGTLLAVEAGTPWLATAGTGDVLAGIIGALVAAAAADHPRLDPRRLAGLAATGAWVHGRAARRASARHAGGPITALDVAEAVPAVLGEELAAGSQPR